MARPKLRTLIVIATFYTILGCGGENTPSITGGLISNLSESSLTTGSILFHNNTNESVDAILITPSSSDSWGENLLTLPLLPAASKQFDGFPSGIYDLQSIVLGPNSLYFSRAQGIAITTGGTTQFKSLSTLYSGSIQVFNNSTYRTIIGIYISPSTSTTWGPNQISNPVTTGQSEHFLDISPDNYDIKIVWNTGTDSVYFNNRITSLSLALTLAE